MKSYIGLTCHNDLLKNVLAVLCELSGGSNAAVDSRKAWLNVRRRVTETSDVTPGSFCSAASL